MKKISLLLASILATVTISGCDAFDSIINSFTGGGSQNEENNSDNSQNDETSPEDTTDDGSVTPTVNYNVTFNANGGSGNMSAQTTSGSSYMVPRCEFTYTGYRFVSWALDSIDGAKYNILSTITGITKDITLYATWVEKGPNDEIDDNYGDYYSTITGDLSGTSLLNALNTLNTSKKKKSFKYADVKWTQQYTEKDWTGAANVSGKMFGFYDNALVCETWDGQATWNREHVWPDSMGGDSLEGDNFMTRPTSVSINSERHNWYYAESGNETYDPGLYDVNYRGVAARIIFYCAIANKSLDIIDEIGRKSNCMGKLSDLLKWNLQYAPDRSADAPLALRIEQNRNKEVFTNTDLQQNRNPFVDHPEYACRIWGTKTAQTRQVCGL